MSTPQEEFQRDPYDFLSNNVVYPSINVLRQEYLLPAVGGEAFAIRPAPVIPVTVKKVPNANSTTGDVFALVRAVNKDPFPLRAYYLPYMQKKTCGGVLHKSAEWMFTAAMDGCTFGAGSVTADGVCASPCMPMRQARAKAAATNSADSKTNRSRPRSANVPATSGSFSC